MPRHIEFPIPAAPPRPATVDEMNARTLEWATGHGLLTSAQAQKRYDSWDLAAMAYYSLPGAATAHQQLWTDLFGFWFSFDDQFDGPLGLDPAQCRQVCDDLIAVSRDPAALPRPASPLASHVHEAVYRRTATVPDMDTFLWLRPCAGAMTIWVCSIERITGVEIPSAVRCSPVIQALTSTALKLPVWFNDLYTLEREEARGDTANLVLVVQHHQQCDRAQAVATTADMITAALGEFDRLRTEVPELATRLGLSAEERRDLDRYVDTLRSIVNGYYRWERQTVRYRPEGELPADGPGYLEDLVGPRSSGAV